jgi:hypothetical protein
MSTADSIKPVLNANLPTEINGQVSLDNPLFNSQYEWIVAKVFSMVFYDGNNLSEQRFRTKDQSRGNNDIKQHGDQSHSFETDCPMIFTA